MTGIIAVIDSPVDQSNNRGGRPSKYDPAYCEQVIKFMADGYSVTAFAGSIRVARRTVYHWCDQNPEFKEAVDIARAARVLYLEKFLLSGKATTPAIFALKNACPEEWRDRKEICHNADDRPVSVEDKSDSKLAQAVALILAKAPSTKGGRKNIFQAVADMVE